MKFQQWHIHASDEGAVRALMEAGYPYLISTVLAPRGVSAPEEAESLLHCGERLTLDPLLMRDMDKAVARIRAAVARGEKIAVFGDYDVDGITATCLMTDALRRAGADVTYYIPHRLDDGYGLNTPALEKLRAEGAALIVTVDCGITGVAEADFARDIGLDLVITDHHECREALPQAAAVVDPHRPDCPYPFPYLAGCGVALLATIHAANVEELQAKPLYQELMAGRLFRQAVLIRTGPEGRLYAVENLP